ILVYAALVVRVNDVRLSAGPAGDGRERDARTAGTGRKGEAGRNQPATAQVRSLYDEEAALRDARRVVRRARDRPDRGSRSRCSASAGVDRAVSRETQGKAAGG